MSIDLVDRAQPEVNSIRARLTRWPWWVQVLGVYVAFRIVAVVIFLVVAQYQAATGWSGEHPDYLSYVGLQWDASWYRQIATEGYPAQLPLGPDGAVRQNAWAFFPLFPLLARLAMTTGLDWIVAAPAVATVCGAGAVLVIYRLVHGTAAAIRRPGLPLATVAVVCAFPSAPLLQTAYTESLALLLIASSLLLVARRRYEWAAVTVLLLGFTRAVALPMALVVLWHLATRWRTEQPPRRDMVRAGVLVVVAGASGLLWPSICGWATGAPDGYLRTQDAWRSTGQVRPFIPWVKISQFFFGGAGPLLLAVVLLAVTALVLTPTARRLGPEMWAWPVAYFGYLLAVIEPGTSLVRFLLLAFPLGAVTVGWTRSRIWFWAVLAAGIAGQAWWVWTLWRLVPPSGWPP